MFRFKRAKAAVFFLISFNQFDYYGGEEMTANYPDPTLKAKPSMGFPE